MSAAEEDTELRDLLIHTLENNGVLNKIKAELRASVFLALDEQERADNKPTLVNESLRQFLGTREGRLAAGLVTDFLQHFHLDFTLAVLQPEAGLSSALDDPAVTARELGLPGAETDGKAPLILQLLRRREPAVNGEEKPRSLPQELSPGPMTEAQTKFELHSKGNNGEIRKDQLRSLLADLLPHHQDITLDRSVTEITGSDSGDGINLQQFLAMYRRLSLQDTSDHLHPQLSVLDGSDQRASSSSSGSSNISANNDKVQKDVPLSHVKIEDTTQLDDEEEDEIEGDSFFDDPIPKPDKTYGWKEEIRKPNGSISALTGSLALLSEQSSLSGAPKLINLDRYTQDPLKNLKMPSHEVGAGNEEDYIDDFNSTSQRSDKSEVSIGEDLEEELSVDDFTGSDNKLDDLTLDNSISHISDVADYQEDVS